MEYSNSDHPLKSKIQELLVEFEKTEIFNKMLDYTIYIFETQGLGRDYYGYHNIDHELEVAYITLMAAIWEKKLQKLLKNQKTQNQILQLLEFIFLLQKFLIL